MTENELVKKETAPLALSAEQTSMMFGNSKLDTKGLSFNNIPIMRDSAQFDMGNGKYETTLTGHVLLKHEANQWWKVAFDDRGEDDDPMPQCYSIDGEKPCGGTEMQAEECSKCLLNKFKSDPKGGPGKACRNTVRLLFLMDKAVLPVIIIAPPTSLHPLGGFKRWVNSYANDVSAAYTAEGEFADNGDPITEYWPAHVKLSLAEQKFKSGKAASVLSIETLNVVTPKSDPKRLLFLFNMKVSASKAYMALQRSYIETEAVEEAQSLDTPTETNVLPGDDTPI